jgi:hypothetical protein
MSRNSILAIASLVALAASGVAFNHDTAWARAVGRAGGHLYSHSNVRFRWSNPRRPVRVPCVRDPLIR